MSILFFFMEKARRNGMGEQTKTKITPCLSENIAHMEKLFSVCDDIKKKQMNLGKNGDVPCYLTFIEVSVDMGTSALSEVLKYLRTIEKEEIYDVLSQNALGISDATFFFYDRGGGRRASDRRDDPVCGRICAGGQNTG